MLRKGFKEIGILKDEGSSSYHQLNPTSIGFSMHPLTYIQVNLYISILFIFGQMLCMEGYSLKILNTL